MPSFVSSSVFHADRGPHTPRHRSASRPRPILKTAAKAMKAVFVPEQTNGARLKRGHVRSASVPGPVHTEPRQYRDDHRGRDRSRGDGDRGRSTREVAHYEEYPRGREPSRRRQHEHYVKEPRKEEPRRGHRRAISDTHTVHHTVHQYNNTYLQPTAYYYRDTREPSPRKSSRRTEKDMLELVEKFANAGFKVTCSHRKTYRTPPPSPSYYQYGAALQASFRPPAPPAPRHLAIPPRAIPPGYAPSVYNGYY